MKQKEFDTLAIGDIVRHKHSASSVVITQSFGDTKVAVRTLLVSNPDEWDLMSKHGNIRPYQGKLTIIRGLPGSGKSTLAKTLFSSCDHFEADMYHIDTETGKYNFNPDKIKDSHEWCQNSVKSSLLLGKNVVVTNTFTQLWEIKPYIEMGYDFTIIEALGNFNNIHNVPQDALDRMKERWEVLPQCQSDCHICGIDGTCGAVVMGDSMCTILLTSQYQFPLMKLVDNKTIYRVYNKA